MNRTDIEYLDYTWNPLAMRCTPISEGCEHCWHIRMAKRMAGNPRFPDEVRAAYAGDHEPILIEDRLEEPLRLCKPSRIGVQFMGDLFHKAITISTIFKVLGVMEDCPQHTFLILTKRPQQMKDSLRLWYEDSRRPEDIMPNVWGLVTAENQKQADLRIPLLLQCQFAVRGVSIEPMLGAVDVSRWLGTVMDCDLHGPISNQYWTTWKSCGLCIEQGFENKGLIRNPRGGIDWIICGAETGPGARTMDPDWARGVRDQCKEAGVSYFFKQMSNKAPIPDDLLVREWPGGAE